MLNFDDSDDEDCDDGATLNILFSWCTAQLNIYFPNTMPDDWQLLTDILEIL